MADVSQVTRAAGATPPAVAPDRNLALELVRVTEAAAMAAARWVGRGDKNAADQAAVDAMRLMLDTVAIDITRSPSENVERVAEAKGATPRDVTVVVLERDRHDDLIAELREAGAKVNLIRDGDVAPAIAAAQPATGVDMLYGIGGTPEGVISAAALKCVGGGIQGRLWPRDDEERQALVDAGLDPKRVLHTEDLVAGDDVYVAETGVTTGALLRGPRRDGDRVYTDSIVMRSRSGTVRRIEGQHQLEKLARFTGRQY